MITYNEATHQQNSILVWQMQLVWLRNSPAMITFYRFQKKGNDLSQKTKILTSPNCILVWQAQLVWLFPDLVVVDSERERDQAWKSHLYWNSVVF